ncbi:MAG: IS66 family transposase [Ruminococcus sp.]
MTAEELLGSYDGIVQTDGLGSYGSGEYLHAGCWSHARRKFVDSIPENDKTAKRQKLSGSSTEHLPWSVKQEKQTSRRKRYWRCGRKR